MRPIFIPDTAISDDTAIVAEFYRYVYYGHGDGGIFGPILGSGPDSDVYAALYYSGEVRNGGHHQFIANSEYDNRISQAALSGLVEIQALPQHALLAEMIAWALANSESVDSRPLALDSLDDRFFDQQDRTSIEARAALWIRTHPALKVIPEVDFMALLQKPALSPSSPSSPSLPSPRAKVGVWDRIRRAFAR